MDYAYAEGIEARKAGHQPSANPYAPGTTSYAEWASGGALRPHPDQCECALCVTTIVEDGVVLARW